MSRGIGLAYRVLVACMVVAALMAVEAVVAFGAAPGIGSVQVSHVGSHGATVECVVEPGGLETAYSVQYGTSTAYGSETTPVDVTPNPESATVAVSVSLAGLQPDTEYHVRLVARNEEGEQTGSDVAFATYSLGANVLPDGRVYELVSQFHDADAEVIWPGPIGNHFSRYPFEAAADGSALTFAGSPGSKGGSGNNGYGRGNQYFASRDGNGWGVEDITSPGIEQAEYLGFTKDLSAGFTQVRAELPFVTTETPQKLMEFGGNSFAVLYERPFDGNLFRPLFTTKPPHRYDSSEKELRGEKVYENELILTYGGVSADAGHVLFGANDTFTSNAVLGTEGEFNLYDESDGQMSLVNVLPDGSTKPNATFGGRGGSLSRDVSIDGSRLFWTDLNSGIVYVREQDVQTVQVSQGPAEFWTASPDGRYAFYTEAGELWRFDVEDGTRLELAGSEGGVQGVIATNETGEDGAYVYFVSTEKLSEGQNAAKQQAVAGRDNVYVYEPTPGAPGGSRTAFVTTLASGDAADWVANLARRTSNVSPDGHGLMFMSSANLTGAPYPNEGTDEVYVYDSNDASLFCASCRPQASGGYVGGGPSATYVYRWISEDADKVFFSSYAPLVAQDINGRLDAYEWERDGSGNCHETEGCVYMLSNGVEGTASFVDASVSGDDVFVAAIQKLVPEGSSEEVEIYDARANGTPPVSPPECSGTGCQGIPGAAPLFATPASVTFEGVGNFPTSNKNPSTKSAIKSKSAERKLRLAKALRTCHRKRGKRRSLCEKDARVRYGSKSIITTKVNRGGK